MNTERMQLIRYLMNIRNKQINRGRKNQMKKLLLILISTLTIFMSACGNTDTTKEREPSTRVPNSVVGKWYENNSDEGMRIWDFNDKGIYYVTGEKMYGKEDETYSIRRREYSIEGKQFF